MRAKRNKNAGCGTKDFEALLAEVRGCRICRDCPDGKPLAHEPRPVFQISKQARLGVFGQAPGLRAHEAGKPFSDPSGVRLRDWMGISEQDFYDIEKTAILPMGFCFPGYNDKGGDLPPRRECARTWRSRILDELPNLELALLVGSYAQNWHLGRKSIEGRARTLTATVADWRNVLGEDRQPRFLPLPHPSWRNNAWISSNRWFEDELLPVLKERVAQLLGET